MPRREADPYSCTATPPDDGIAPASAKSTPLLYLGTLPPQTLAMPPPPQVWGRTQAPQLS